MKHAFPNQPRGAIEVGLIAEPQRLILLTVADNGVGSGNVDVMTAETLGLRLVNMFARQLNAEMTVDSSSDLRYSIRFAKMIWQEGAVYVN